MARPLEGIRIADFSHIIAGPLATHFLCMLGAEVIKVEPPAGDDLRRYTQRPELHGMAEAFVGVSAGKKSIILDLKTEFGREAARKLIASSDVLVENFRPGVIKRLGLGHEALQQDNPSLIFCSISGYGQTGPMRDYPAIDQIIQSVSGLMGLSGEPGSKPMRIGIPIVDTYSALLSAFAIVSAVLQRERDPERRGQYIDVAMLDASMLMMASALYPLMMSGIEPKLTGNRGYSGAPTADTFATMMGDLTIGAVQQVQFERLCAALDRPRLIADERFLTPALRIRNDEALQAELTAVLQTKDALEWEAILSEAGVPAGAVRHVSAALAFEQLSERSLFLDVPVPSPAINQGQNQARILNAGFQFARDTPGTNQPPPKLGEHTDEILRELGIERPAQ